MENFCRVHSRNLGRLYVLYFQLHRLGDPGAGGSLSQDGRTGDHPSNTLNPDTFVQSCLLEPDKSQVGFP